MSSPPEVRGPGGYGSDPFLRQMIARKIEAGLTVAVIAEQLGLPPRRIRFELMRYGATRPRGAYQGSE